MLQVSCFLPNRSIAFVSYVVLLLLAPHGNAQSGNASALIGQLSAAFSPNQPVQQIQASGTATWNAGSLVDTGTVSLTASADGDSQLQLSLTTSGQHVEGQTGLGSQAICQWSGSDGLSHSISATNCWKATNTFFPALNLQPTVSVSGLGLVDLGLGTVGFSQNSYRHLQGQLILSQQSARVAAVIAKQSTFDLGLDPVSMLPTVLAYSVLPDSGSSQPISMEIHYSDYRAVNGIQIPFTIERYINGSLQLQIILSSVQTN